MDISEFTPMNGWMVVRTDDPGDMTESGLIYKVSELSEHLHMKGTVLETSPVSVRLKKKDGTYVHRELENPIKVGARILFEALLVSKFYFVQFRARYGQEYALLKPSDVLLYENPDADGDKGIDDLDLSITSGKVKAYDYGKNDDNNRAPDTGA